MIEISISEAAQMYGVSTSLLSTACADKRIPTSRIHNGERVMPAEDVDRFITTVTINEKSSPASVRPHFLSVEPVQFYGVRQVKDGVDSWSAMLQIHAIKPRIFPGGYTCWNVGNYPLVEALVQVDLEGIALTYGTLDYFEKLNYPQFLKIYQQLAVEVMNSINVSLREKELHGYTNRRIDYTLRESFFDAVNAYAQKRGGEEIK